MVLLAAVGIPIMLNSHASILSHIFSSLATSRFTLISMIQIPTTVTFPLHRDYPYPSNGFLNTGTFQNIWMNTRRKRPVFDQL